MFHARSLISQKPLNGQHRVLLIASGTINRNMIRSKNLKPLAIIHKDLFIDVCLLLLRPGWATIFNSYRSVLHPTSTLYEDDYVAPYNAIPNPFFNKIYLNNPVRMFYKHQSSPMGLTASGRSVLWSSSSEYVSQGL